VSLSSSAMAPDKKKPAQPHSAVDAFFDAPTTPKNSSIDAQQNAPKGVATTEKKGLEAKAAIIADEIVVKVHSAFAAEQIVIDKKLGCQPARGMTKLAFFTFDEVPSEGVPMSLCINLESKAGREVAMTISIVDPRNSRVVKAEDVVDFRNKNGRVDHIVDFPAPFFKLAGPYQYLVEMDGKEVARLPLFDVRVE
jgi:hypothetical protein